jgi:hypothetical protein
VEGDAEAGFLRLVMEETRGDQPARPAADEREEVQRPFRRPPATVERGGLVEGIGDERDEAGNPVDDGNEPRQPPEDRGGGDGGEREQGDCRGGPLPDAWMNPKPRVSSHLIRRPVVRTGVNVRGGHI